MVIERAYENFFERVDTQRENVIREFLSLPKNSNKAISWTRIGAARLKRIWLDYGKSGVVRDEKGIENISNIVLTNIARIQAITELVGHESYSVKEDVEDMFPDMEKSWDRFWSSNFITNQYSDYAMKPLQDLYVKLFQADTSEEKLQIIDRVLNVVHQRGDIADLFVEKGIQTLNEIAAQGGYQTPS